MRSLSATLLLLIAGCGGGGNNAEAPPSSPPAANEPAPILPAVRQAWHVPTCSSVTGAPVTFTSDGGLTRAAIQKPAADDYFTYGVVALEGGSTLAAIVGTRTLGSDAELYFSTDAGCSWQPSGHVFKDVNYYLDAALTPAGTHAYAWSTNRQFLQVIAPTGVATPLPIQGFPPWVSGPYGVAIDPGNPHRVRIALYECERASCGVGSAIFETVNGGTTWTRMGMPAPYGALDLTFSPTNMDHAIGVFGTWEHVTLDGGNQWIAAQGVPDTWQASEAAIGADSLTVWLLAYEDEPAPAAAVFVSYDGGLNYQPAFESSTENPFAFNPSPQSPYDPLSHARLFPHPTDTDIVYLAHTSAADGKSYLYRYDAGLDQLTKQSWPSTEGAVWALTFNPMDPEVLYLALSAVQ